MDPHEELAGAEDEEPERVLPMVGGVAPGRKHVLAANGLPVVTLSGNLVGELPPSFTNFRQLRSLSFVDTKITGVLPTNMGDMAALEMIWLDHNPELKGVVPVRRPLFLPVFFFFFVYSCLSLCRSLSNMLWTRPSKKPLTAPSLASYRRGV